jgi:hypothetical protein
MRRESVLVLIALCCCTAAAAHAHAALPARVPTPAAADTGKAITVCVLAEGEIREISATFDTATGDTLVGGRPLAVTYPASSPPYAAGADWFISMEPVLAGDGPYRRKTVYGLPRILGPADLRRIGEYRGVPMFAEPTADPKRPEVVYFMVRPGCVFQPYQAAVVIGGVRG